MTLSLGEYIVQSARHMADLQCTDGSLPVGHNGPWFDADTPVRTTAHWAMSFAYAYEQTGESLYERCAVACCDYLVSNIALPSGDVFLCRNSDKAKDRSNGLIGQAWAVEPLLTIGEKFAIEKYLEIAKRVLGGHRYCSVRNGWFEREVGGEETRFCNTVNQQIWFAVMAWKAGINGSELREHAIDFFRELPDRIQYAKFGIIRHVREEASVEQKLARRVVSRLRVGWGIDVLECRSLGYHAFIVYALALAKEFSAGALSFTEPGYRKIIENTFRVAKKRLSRSSLGSNPYAWSYNPIGIELAFAWHTFSGSGRSDHAEQDIAQYWLSEQMAAHAAISPPLMNRNTNDPVVLAARLYEATRLPASYGVVFAKDEAEGLVL